MAQGKKTYSGKDRERILKEIGKSGLGVTELCKRNGYAYSKVSLGEFCGKCAKRLSKISKSAMAWREKRMAERDSIYATPEEYGLVKRSGATALGTA